MNFRITTNMMMNTYNYNLMGVTNKMNDASETVQTGRQFNSYSDDPTAATLAYSYRRDLWRNSNQLANTQSMQAKIQVAWTAAGTVVDTYGVAEAKPAIMSAINGATGTGRQVIGITLTELADSMVNTLNAQYGDQYAFGGSDSMSPPFSWNEDTGNLEYRGININASPGTADYYKLQEMIGTNDKNYIDVGIGLTYTEGSNSSIIDSTAFNSALSGLDLVGYGVDEDGDPLCMISLVKELGEIFSRCDADSGDYHSTSDEEIANRLYTKFEASLSAAIGGYVELDAKQSFLNANEAVLIDVQDNLNEQICAIEDVDAAEAIMEMSYQQYCYSAALKIGTQILSQSLLDYM